MEKLPEIKAKFKIILGTDSSKNISRRGRKGIRKVRKEIVILKTLRPLRYPLRYFAIQKIILILTTEKTEITDTYISENQFQSVKSVFYLLL